MDEARRRHQRRAGLRLAGPRASSSQHNDYLLEAAAQSDGASSRSRPSTWPMPGAEREIERCAADGRARPRRAAAGQPGLGPERRGRRTPGCPGAQARPDPAVPRHGAGGHDIPAAAAATSRRFARLRGPESATCASSARTSAADCTDRRARRRPTSTSTRRRSCSSTPDDAAATAMRAVPPGRLLFGSDFPLIRQVRQIDEIAPRLPDPAERAAVLGGNAARLLGLELMAAAPPVRRHRTANRRALGAQPGAARAATRAGARPPALGAAGGHPSHAEVPRRDARRAPASDRSGDRRAPSPASLRSSCTSASWARFGSRSRRACSGSTSRATLRRSRASNRRSSASSRRSATRRENRAFSPHLTLARVPPEQRRDARRRWKTRSPEPQSPAASMRATEFR